MMLVAAKTNSSCRGSTSRRFRSSLTAEVWPRVGSSAGGRIAPNEEICMLVRTNALRQTARDPGKASGSPDDTQARRQYAQRDDLQRDAHECAATACPPELFSFVVEQLTCLQEKQFSQRQGDA
jgi:hypothetical protein